MKGTERVFVNVDASEFIVCETVSKRGVRSERDEDRTCEHMKVTLGN